MTARPALPSTALVLASLLGAASCAALDAPGMAPVHPQRNSLSTDTTTTPDGIVEIEMGAELDPSEHSEVHALFKYGLGERSEFFVGFTPWLDVDNSAVNDSGIGDTVIGMRHRLLEQTVYDPAIAFQFHTKLPTASSSDGLGTGLADFHAALIADRYMSGTNWTGNYQVGVLSEPAQAEVDLEHFLSLAGSRPIASLLDGYAEVALTYVPEQDVEDMSVGAGIGYEIHPSLVLDLGVRLGLTDDAADFQLLFGFTRSLGRLRFRRDAPAP